VEKAHPDIFNILLQILDDGRLTDNRGHVISFKNTVVVCTSNIGTKLIQDEMLKNQVKEPASAKASSHVKTSDDKSAGKQKSKAEDEKDKNKFKGIKEKVMFELTKFFKPELINRFDEVIVFEPLRFQDMIEIVKLQMKGIIKLIEAQDMGFAYTDEVISEIVKAGFDPIYGARPLRRAIQKLIENPISNLIIDGKTKPGDLIRVRVDRDELIFEIEKTVFQPKVTKKYHCQICGCDFENEIIANSTVICPKCGKKNEKSSTKPIS
jgi:ATP-dependent Clp protease ATP-binding subunit ClpA/DNA-directed RNA polymerase subunit RPC12/RpoP